MTVKGNAMTGVEVRNGSLGGFDGAVKNEIISRNGAKGAKEKQR